MTDVVDIMDLFRSRKLSFEDWITVAFGAINKSARYFEAMKHAIDLKSLGESFDYGMRWLGFFDEINSERVPRDYPDRLKEFRELVYILARERYQKL